MKLAHLRGEVLRHGIEEGLTRNQALLIWHILDFDFTSKGISWPGRKRLAKAMGFDNTGSISNLVTQLHEAGYIRREERPGLTNEYDWRPLVARFSKYIKASPENEGLPVEDSRENEGGAHAGMKGGSPEDEGGLHAKVNQSTSREALQGNTSREARDVKPPAPHEKESWGLRFFDDWVKLRQGVGLETALMANESDKKGLRWLGKATGFDGEKVLEVLSKYLRLRDKRLVEEGHPLGWIENSYNKIVNGAVIATTRAGTKSLAERAKERRAQ